MKKRAGRSRSAYWRDRVEGSTIKAFKFLNSAFCLFYFPLEWDVISAPLLMIVILKPKTTKEQVEEVVLEVQKL
ncbi:MAG TPA: hypothetical protein VK692_07065, partial [Chthoniobacterales bacterium]|nr:hypothetical protein [Chthoniobacterales bacterium]